MASRTSAQLFLRLTHNNVQRSHPLHRALRTSSVIKSTGTVSNQPASKNWKEMKQNAKEEVQNVRDDLKSAISGANAQTSQLGGDDKGAFEAIRGDLNSASDLVQKVPRGAYLFGAAGVLPYAGTALTTLYLSRQAALALSPENSTLDAETALALLHHVEGIQVGYGALILSFIGSIHWGLEFAEYNGRKGVPRYLLGIAPVLVAMPTLLLPGQIGLIAQFGAFTGAWFMDQRATTWGWTPKWYSTYRFWLTALVGSSLLLTLGGSNYFGPGEGVATTGRRLAQVNKQAGQLLAQDPNPATGITRSGTIGGDVEAKIGDEAFVELTNVPKKQEEERKAKEEAEKKKKEEAQKKKEEAEKKAQAEKEEKERQSVSKTPGA